jgi:glutamine cyclotransferase
MTSLIFNEYASGTLTYYLLSSGNVLNGIAYNPVGNYFGVTGKDWGYYYQLNMN